jgi:hypothetical protein
VPLVKDSTPEEEDPDLLAALASIEDEEPPVVVKPAEEPPVVEKPSTKSVVPVGVPPEVKPSAEEAPVEESDLTAFLDEKPTPKKTSSRKSTATEEAPSKVKETDLDLDFSDILSNV